MLQPSLPGLKRMELLPLLFESQAYFLFLYLPLFSPLGTLTMRLIPSSRTCLVGSCGVLTVFAGFEDVILLVGTVLFNIYMLPLKIIIPTTKLIITAAMAK